MLRLRGARFGPLRKWRRQRARALRADGRSLALADGRLPSAELWAASR